MVVNINNSQENIDKFHKIFNFVNNMLTIFGLSFIERSNKNNFYRLSEKRLFYGILICIFVLYVFHQQITRFYPHELDNIVLLLLFLYLAVVGTIMAILMIITAVAHAKNLANYLNNPENLELYNLETYDFVKFHTARQFLFSFCVLFGCFLSDYIAGNEHTIEIAIKTMMFFFFPMYNSFCISQFFNYCYWFQRWYWNINQSMQGMLKKVKLSSEKSFNLGIVEMSSWLRMGNRRKLTLSDLANDYDLEMAEEIVRLRRLYHKTHRMTCQLNELYSLRFVLLLLHHCCLMIVYTYWGLRHTLQDLNVPLTAILNFYKAALMSFISVISMVWPCCTTRMEANKTTYLLQDLLARVKEGISRNELQIFSLQLLQKKFQISPYGFFELETKLLLSLLALVGSYLVVLVQYHMMYIALQANKSIYTNSTTLINQTQPFM